MKTVTLANQTRTTLVLNLPYDVVPELATRAVVGTRDHNAASGDRSVRAHRKRISSSVTLLPKGDEGDIVRGLPASVLDAPDVQRALNAWPPKLAAKVLDDTARAKEHAHLAKAGAARTKADAEAKKLGELKARKLAKMAGAQLVDSDETAEAPAPGHRKAQWPEE